jgi:hypothetical protein
MGADSDKRAIISRRLRGNRTGFSISMAQNAFVFPKCPFSRKINGIIVHVPFAEPRVSPRIVANLDSTCFRWL